MKEAKRGTRDRAMQALHKLTLEPAAESRANRHSYGFRAERSTSDAVERCYSTAKVAERLAVIKMSAEERFDEELEKWKS